MGGEVIRRGVSVENPYTTVWNWWNKRQEAKNRAEVERITNGWAKTPSGENKQVDAGEPMRYRIFLAFWRFVESTVPRDPKVLYGFGEYVPQHAVKDTWTARQTFGVNVQTGAYPLVQV